MDELPPVPHPDIDAHPPKAHGADILVALGAALALIGILLGLVFQFRALEQAKTIVANERLILAQHAQAEKLSARQFHRAIADVEKLLSKALARHDTEVSIELERLLRRLRRLQFQIADVDGEPVVIIRPAPTPTRTRPGKGPR
jgi:hypothetical protein